jgi:cytochrome c oxidase subunit II
VLTRYARVILVAATFIFLATIVALADDSTAMVATAGKIAVVAADGTFTPGTITLKVGQTTVIHFSSTSGVHGVQSDALGIPQTTIMPGKGVDVTVTPKKAGTYVLHCTIPCGSGHDAMALTVKVEQ